jgi:hypothetical protein
MHSKEKIKKIRERAEIRSYIYATVKEHRIKQSLISESAEFWDSSFAKMFGLNSLRNAAQMAVRGVKNTMTTIGGETRVLLKSLAASIIPGITSDKSISEMAKEEREKVKERISETDAKYADVIQKVDNAFKLPDAQMALFLANPGAYIGAHVVADTAYLVRDVVTALLPETEQEKQQREDQTFAARIKSALGIPSAEELERQRQESMELARQGQAELAAERNANVQNLQRILNTRDAELQRQILSSVSKSAAPVPAPQTTIREQYQQQLQQARQLPYIDLNNLTPQQKAAVLAVVNQQTKEIVDRIKNPQTIAAINNSEHVKNGQVILVQTLTEDAKNKINSVNWEDLKNKIDWAAYFKQSNITDSKQQEEQKKQILNGATQEAKNIQNQLIAIVKDAYKKEAVNKLNAIKSQNNPPPAPELISLINKTLGDLEKVAPTPKQN